MYKNKQDEKEWHDRYYKENRLTLLEKKKKYYQDNKEKRSLYDKERYKKIRKKKSEYNLMYRLRNKLKINRKQSGYYELNKKDIWIKQKEFVKKNPWYKSWNSINSRVKTNIHYIKKGIKNLLDVEDLHRMYIRDRASSMKRPSVHRIDNDGDYSVTNCLYIELGKHISMHRTGRI